jgi:hypothetical protein
MPRVPRTMRGMEDQRARRQRAGTRRRFEDETSRSYNEWAW